MSMKDAINGFATQFSYEPEVHNADALRKAEHVIVSGMGGSHLAADIVAMVRPERDVRVVSDYGLPPFSDAYMRECLCIASSYSGNTEEAISFAEEAHARGLPLAVMGVGGRLIEFAREKNVPYVLIPDANMQPRSALGFSLLALARLIGDSGLIGEIASLGHVLRPTHWEEQGSELAETLEDRVPIIYTSVRNAPIAYNWKIKFNETGKIPAFYNLFPELNHNEMTGFDVQENNRHLSDQFHFLMISDETDDSRITKRLHTTAKLYHDRSLLVTEIPLEGDTRLVRAFNSLLLADWASFFTAKLYGVESEEVPMVEEFKKLIA